MTARKAPGNLWKPGQSGNPKGRPKGSGPKQKLERQTLIALAEGHGLNLQAGALLRSRGTEVVAEVLRIAFMPDEQVQRIQAL